MDQVHLLGPLAVALVLSSLIGLEREIHNKSAGLRTHTLVGLGSALSVLLFLCVVLIAFTFIKLFKVDLSQARGE